MAGMSESALVIIVTTILVRLLLWGPYLWTNRTDVFRFRVGHLLLLMTVIALLLWTVLYAN